MTPIGEIVATRRPPANVILGPADADHFRVKVGRYGDRWYCDPLPACDKAPAWDGEAPSITTVKKASGSDWSYVALKRVAHHPTDRLHQLADLDPLERYDALKNINSHGLTVAAGRGTIVHWWMEDMLDGQPMRTVTVGGRITQASIDEAETYKPAIVAWFDHYQPELVYAEFVAIHRTLNGVGYGGTADAIIRIDGKLYGVDWKSRGADSDHGAYPEEAAQIAASATADYIIIEGAHGPERANVPNLEAGLVVSIRPDGIRNYPTSLDPTHWEAMHAWWVARRKERTYVGKPWAPTKIFAPTPAPAGVRPPPFDADLLPVSDGGNLSPAEIRDMVRTNPDEGGPADDHAFDLLQVRYNALGPTLHALVTACATEAMQHGVGFHSSGGNRTVRRFEILRGLCLLDDDADNDLLRIILAETLGPKAHYPSLTVGHLLGSLTANEAARFAQRCSDGPFTITYTPAGVPVLGVAA